MQHCATVATLPNMIPCIYAAHIGIKILRPLATPKIIGLDCQKALKYTNRLARVRRLRGAIFPSVYTMWTQNLVHMLSKDILSSPAQVGGGANRPPPSCPSQITHLFTDRVPRIFASLNQNQVDSPLKIWWPLPMVLDLWRHSRGHLRRILSSAPFQCL